METTARGALIGVAAFVLFVAAAAFASAVPVADDADAAEARKGDVFPIGERLSYAVSWMGIKCGRMDIASFVEETETGDPIYRIVVFARTSRFFDGIYKVRSRLDSFFDPSLMSSIRYEQQSLEKKSFNEEIWTVDEAAGEVVRSKNGEVERIPIEVDRAYDPVAFIYRLRMIETSVGATATLGLMTSKGVLETDAQVTRHKQIRTKHGRHDAAAVVPEPRDKMMFSKSGEMVVWIDREPPHRLCRLDFDLSFGTLVASLIEFESTDSFDPDDEWSRWIGDTTEDP